MLFTDINILYVKANNNWSKNSWDHYWSL